MYQLILPPEMLIKQDTGAARSAAMIEINISADDRFLSVQMITQQMHACLHQHAWSNMQVNCKD